MHAAHMQATGFFCIWSSLVKNGKNWQDFLSQSSSKRERHMFGCWTSDTRFDPNISCSCCASGSLSEGSLVRKGVYASWSWSFFPAKAASFFCPVKMFWTSSAKRSCAKTNKEGQAAVSHPDESPRKTLPHVGDTEHTTRGLLNKIKYESSRTSQTQHSSDGFTFQNKRQRLSQNVMFPFGLTGKALHCLVYERSIKKRSSKRKTGRETERAWRQWQSDLQRPAVTRVWAEEEERTSLGGRMGTAEIWAWQREKPLFLPISNLMFANV